MNKNKEYKPVFYENFQTAALNITRREWFAGMALQGMIASGDANDNQLVVIAQEAYKLADAMIRAGKGAE